MRKLLSFLLLFIAAQSCIQSKDYTLFRAEHRTEKRNRAGDRQHYAKSGETEILLCGIQYPDGVDWREDSMKVCPDTRIVLMKDGETLVSIPAGKNYEVSDEPDMHHLINGHLYTEYSNDRETVIRRDGKELLRYPAREFLRGLLVEDADVYTLGQNRDGDGFSLRLNGEVLLLYRNGRVFDGFGMYDIDRTGALFRDNGRLCFSFFSAAGKVLVIDGMEYPYDEALLEEDHETAKYEANLLSYSNLDSPKIIAYLDNCWLWAGEFLWEGAVMFVAPEGACRCGDVLYVAYTPMERGERPVLWKGGEKCRIDFNGFLTGIEVACPLPEDGP